MISTAVKELNSAKQTRLGQIKDLEAQIQKIDSALAALSGSVVSSVASAPVAKAKGGYTRTPAQRKALSMKLKAHWAKKSAAIAPAAAPVAVAPVAKPAKKKQKAMSPLGKLRIKLGSLNRYKKHAEAKKVKAQIAQLEAKK